jgi:hypothetical protein
MRPVAALLLAGVVLSSAACGSARVAPTPVAPTPTPTIAPSVEPSSSPSPSLQPTPDITPSPTPSGLVEGTRRYELPNLGLSIDLAETWRPVLELGAVELRDLSRADMGIGRELDRWIHTATRFEPGGDMGLVAVNPDTPAMLRIGIILPADDRLDAVTLGKALFGEDEGVRIASAEPMTIADGQGARLEGDRADGPDTTHHLWFPFVGPSGEWLELGSNVVASRQGDFDADVDAAVASLRLSGQPQGRAHRAAPDPDLEARLPATIDDRSMDVTTGAATELEYAGVWDSWRAVFGGLQDGLPALRGVGDQVRFGVAFSSPASDGSSIEIYALRAPGFAAEDYRPFLDGLPEQGWVATDRPKTTFQNGDDVLGVRNDTIYLLRGTPDLVAAAAAQLLP